MYTVHLKNKKILIKIAVAFSHLKHNCRGVRNSVHPYLTQLCFLNGLILFFLFLHDRNVVLQTTFIHKRPFFIQKVYCSARLWLSTIVVRDKQKEVKTAFLFYFYSYYYKLYWRLLLFQLSSSLFTLSCGQSFHIFIHHIIFCCNFSSKFYI